MVISPTAYVHIFMISMYLLCFWVGVSYMQSADNSKLLRVQPLYIPVIVAFLIIYFLGWRPISFEFGDSVMYAYSFRHLSPSQEIHIDLRHEWLFDLIELLCVKLQLSIYVWFLLIEAGYIGLQLWALKKLLHENVWLALLFLLSSFSFYSFGVNGIRNGVACAMMVLALAYLVENKWIPYLLLCFLAWGCHHSIILPAIAMLVAKTVLRNPLYSIYIWICSIALSLLMGNQLTQWIANLGIDARLSSYTDTQAVLNQASEFSHIGFRWDFLLYSSIPIFLTWYVSQHKLIQDKTFNIIANTYMLCNAFWVIVIRSSFSNRFAYLSWFLFPIVIAYAFIRLPIWSNQDSKTGTALLLHATFTFTMYLIGKIT